MPTEQVTANFRELRVNNQPSFSATVTNYRLLFWQIDVIHDIRLDAIAALSWGRLQRPLWELIGGGLFVLVGIFALRKVFALGFFMLLIGGLIIAQLMLGEGGGRCPTCNSNDTTRLGSIGSGILWFQ